MCICAVWSQSLTRKKKKKTNTLKVSLVESFDLFILFPAGENIRVSLSSLFWFLSEGEA